MKLEEWQQQFDKKIVEQIDQFIKEDGDQFIKPDPLKSKEQQLSQLRERLLENVLSKKFESQVEKALKLIRDEMPHTVSREVWESVENDFSQAEANLLNYFERSEGENQGDSFIPVYEMCGFNFSTLTHCYEFATSLYKKKAFEDAKGVILFLMQMNAKAPEYWIALAMCENQLGNFKEAIEIYTLGQSVFPNNPLFHLYCADNYCAVRDNVQAKVELEKAKAIMDQDPMKWATWDHTYELIAKKAK